MKILFYGESPVVVTGLAQVSRLIIDALQEDGHEVEVVPINHLSVVSYDKNVFPYTIVPLVEGDDVNATKTAIKHIHESDYDIFFCSTDFGRDIPVFQAIIEERQKGRRVFVAGYYAVDCDLIPSATFEALAYCNAKIVYTKHGKQVIEGLRPEFAGLVNVMYLPTEPNVFYPLSEEERRAARREIFKIENDDTFLCVSVNRNQGRKDLIRLMAIFHEFHQSYRNSTLYMHCQKDDLGGNLFIASHTLGMGSSLDNPEIIFTHEDYNALQGYSREFLNRVYNAADVLLSASTGEGWGLSTTEAMCTQLPVIVPNNTAFTEIVGESEERGYLVKSGGDIDHRIVLYGMTCNPRDIVHADDFLAKMEHVYSHRDEAKAKAVAGREWAMQYIRETMKEQWKKFFSDLNSMMPQLLEAQTI
ncbi:MAG TPA: glycosyltransferase [Ktedonobacteraceae bacterium]|nr:glycosyltransferase [Ktedonobacteraceae bacterium]